MGFTNASNTTGGIMSTPQGISFNNPVGGIDQFAKEMQQLEYSIPRAPGQTENIKMPIRVSDMGGTLQDFYTNRNLTGATTGGVPTDANTRMDVWDDLIDWDAGGRMDYKKI
jgi:hypothetical protein